MNWTEERTELLKKLWADGCSASQIAAELGYITRNSVIGKIHRLGLSGRGRGPKKATSPLPASKRVRRPNSVFGATNTIKPWQPVEPLAPVPPETPMEKLAAKLPTSCSLMELTSDKCHWPIGNPQDRDKFFFCGAKTIDGFPYCGYHSRMAYQPAADRRRERRLARG